MKKLLSLILALTLVLSMSSVAFADEASNVEGSDMTEITITKNYEATNEDTTSPAEKFNFTIERTSVTDAATGVTVETMPIATIGTVSYTAGEAGTDNKSKTITVTLPEYNSVGIYTYTIKETLGTTAGVTYYAKDIILVVTVQQDSNGKIRVAAVHTEDGANGTTAEGTKKDNFPNIYSAGSLAVRKIVTGNLGDQQKEFNVTVTFNAPEGKTVREAISYMDGTENQTIPAGEDGWIGSKTVQITLKHNETITFNNIPYGVTYTVVEDSYVSEGYDAAVYSFSDSEKEIDTVSDTVEITNNKESEVDTGIILDNMPYILLLVVVCAGLFVFINKKRAMED